MGCGDDAHIHALLAHAAEPAHGTIFQQLEQLGLQAGLHVADLVEEQCAALCRLDQAEFAFARIGERAAFVAEQLRLQQLCWQGSAVQLDEGLVAARAVEVQRARDQLLAGAGLAHDQHRGRLAVLQVCLCLQQQLHRRLEFAHSR